MIRRLSLFLAVVLALASLTGVAHAQGYPSQPINIMAPAAPGGGWDSTARAMQAALQQTGGQNVTVYNVPGAGGTVGLAQFVNDHSGKTHELMVMGLVMVGAIETNKAPVNLSQVTPIASLTSEYMAVVVPAASKYQTFADLIADFKANPTSVSWGGGSAGGTDHILVGLIAKAVGVDPKQINYIAHAGGGEAKAALLSGALSAGVSGLSEFKDQVDAGQLRLLAVSSPERLEGVDAPTIKESGVDVILANWRAVVAPAGIGAEDRAAIVKAIQTMHDSQAWKDALAKNGWQDFFKAGDNFAAFLNSEIFRIRGVLADIGLIEPLPAAAYPSAPINIMAPAAPGGWDSTARAMQSVLAAQTGQNVTVYNVPGAGGTIGLAQFVNDHGGKTHELMVMGLVMIGSIETNKAPVSLSQITPIASLTSEWMAVVVPANSPYKTFADLVAAFKADPTAISWGGGSAGGTDHILVGLIAKAAGVDPKQINYIAHAGGGEAKAALLSGALSAGVSGLSEFKDQVDAGQLRLLAVSSPERLEGVDAATIKESGLDVVLANWRAVVAPGNLSPEARADIVAMIEKMRASPEWAEVLKQRGWNDFFQSGDTFAAFLTNEVSRIQGVLRDIGLTQ